MLRNLRPAYLAPARPDTVYLTPERAEAPEKCEVHLRVREEAANRSAKSVARAKHSIRDTSERLERRGVAGTRRPPPALAPS